MDKTLETLLANSRKTKALHPDDIPSLDLYIDQIIALMCSHLDSTDGKEPLTRTMIHNYSKAGLISPVKGKKYSKEHILQMLVIYSLKNTLSIAEIKRILDGAARDGIGEKQLAACFEEQISRRTTIHDEMPSLDKLMQDTGMNTNSTADVISFLLTLTDITDMLTCFASAITHEYFPEPPGKKK